MGFIYLFAKKIARGINNPKGSDRVLGDGGVGEGEVGSDEDVTHMRVTITDYYTISVSYFMNFVTF